MNPVRLFLASLLSFTLLSATGTRAAQILWSTGEPQAATTRDEGAINRRIVWQYVSGYVDATTPQRYAAAPFSLSTESRITAIDAFYSDKDPDLGSHTNPSDVGFIVWARNGLSAPTTIIQQGSFGSYVEGARYFGTDVDFENDFRHSHAVDFLLPKGDYYLSLHSVDTTIFWVTGGRQPDTAVEQDFIWRSRMLPTPGFEAYTFPGSIDLLIDKKDVYNPIFSIIGEPVPEPDVTSLLLTLSLSLPMLPRARRIVGKQPASLPRLH